MTVVPLHIVSPGDAVIVTAGVTSGFTVMVTGVLVTVIGVAQTAVLVSSQVTTSPLARLVVEYDALFDPTGLPFTYHW